MYLILRHTCFLSAVYIAKILIEASIGPVSGLGLGLGLRFRCCYIDLPRNSWRWQQVLNWHDGIRYKYSGDCQEIDPESSERLSTLTCCSSTSTRTLRPTAKYCFTHKSCLHLSYNDYVEIEDYIRQVISDLHRP